MSRKRDYAVEYAKRIERLMAEGFSRSQARGHVKTKEITDTKTGQTRTIKLERSVRLEHVRARVQADRARAFGGNPPQRQRGETKIAYDDRLAEMRQETFDDREPEDFGDVDYDNEPEDYSDYESEYSWDNFDDFRDEMLDEGLNEHEIYELWFGY
jgi:uncharacterized protein YoaH (UPF0181 family)